YLPAALEHSHDNDLTACATALNLLPALRGVHIASLAADEGFIYLDFAGQLAVSLVLHGKADTMKHVPCTLLSDPKRSVNLPRTDTVLHAGLHPDSREPLIQAECGVLHDRANLDAELCLRMAVLALPQAAGSEIANVPRSASRANDSVFPFRAMSYKVAHAVIGVRKVDDCLLKCLRFACHEPIMRLDV